MNTANLKSFQYLENGMINFSILDTVKISKTLDPGLYTLKAQAYPKEDVLLNILDTLESIEAHNFQEKDKLEELFTSFFNKAVINKMAKLGFTHKVGVLLYGKEGTGKSTIIKHYCKKLIKQHNALVFYLEGGVNGSGLPTCWDFIKKVRKIQKNPIIIILEEIDSYTTNQTGEGELKKILDGNDSINNCLTIATTNYLDRIPNAIKDRPSRFKYVINVEGIDSEEEIQLILENMIGDIFSKDEIKKFSLKLKGSSLDMIKQFGLDKIMDLKSYPGKSKNKLGF